MRIYAGNLAPEVTEDDLRETFQVFGKVSFVNIIQEHVPDTPATAGMIGMPVKVEAKAAIAALNGTSLKGKSLTVNEAGVRSL